MISSVCTNYLYYTQEDTSYTRALHLAKTDPYNFTQNIKKFRIESEEQLFTLAETILDQDANLFASSIISLSLDDETKIPRLIRMLADKNPDVLVTWAPSLEAIENQEIKFECLSIIASISTDHFFLFIIHYFYNTAEEIAPLIVFIENRFPGIAENYLSEFPESVIDQVMQMPYYKIKKFIEFAQEELTAPSTLDILQLKKYYNEIVASISEHRLDKQQATIMQEFAHMLAQREHEAFSWITQHVQNPTAPHLETLLRTSFTHPEPIINHPPLTPESYASHEKLFLYEWNKPEIPYKKQPIQRLLYNINKLQKNPFPPLATDVIALCLTKPEWYYLIPKAYDINFLSAPIHLEKINNSLYAIALDKCQKDFPNLSFYENYPIGNSTYHIILLLRGLYLVRSEIKDNPILLNCIDNLIASLTTLEKENEPKPFTLTPEEDIYELLSLPERRFAVLRTGSLTAHATALALEKDGVTVYNTGYGLGNHAKGTASPRHFQTHMTISYPQTENTLKRIASRCIYNTAPNDTLFYTFLRSLGTEEPPSQSPIDYEQVQKRGTCSAQCIMAFLRHYILTHVPGTDSERLATYKWIKSRMLRHLIDACKEGISPHLQEPITAKYQKLLQTEDVLKKQAGLGCVEKF